MKRILLLTGILILAFTAAAFAADSDTTTGVSLTVNTYVDIAGGGTASGGTTDAAYETGNLDLTEVGTGLTAKSNSAFNIKGKLDLYIGTSQSNHPNLNLTVAGTGGQGLKTLTTTDQDFVVAPAATNSSAYTQDYAFAGITPENLAKTGGNYSATVTFVIYQP